MLVVSNLINKLNCVNFKKKVFSYNCLQSILVSYLTLEIMNVIERNWLSV